MGKCQTQEKWNAVTIDEMGRVLLPRKLRELMGWSQGDKLMARISATDENAIILQKTEMTAHQALAAATERVNKTIADSQL